ncbi:hypothetical protein F66182_3934 [Fusarium sp. NRRL 66182]|nr:hypothetical protein F66182_3934 [Fusarium sp. NRRL 66182]
MMRKAIGQKLKPGARLKQGKMFKRIESQNGGPVYTVNREGPKAKPPKERDYFQINDILLDLDDYFSKAVRQSTEEDESQALKKWSQDPKRQQLQSKLQKLENELDWSRLKAFEMASKPTNSWRLGSHDILSAALGAPSPAPLIASPDGQTGSPTAETQSDILHLVCAENGISGRAEHNDSLLLSWLQSRTRLSKAVESFKHLPLPPVQSQLAAALKDQNSVTSIRRLLSHSLSSHPDDISFRQPLTSRSSPTQNDMSSTVRDACVRVLEQEDGKGAHDLLVFLGNLSQRLSSRGDHIGAPLCGFGLRLSADICKPQASRTYLGMGFEYGHWTTSDYALKDVLHALETYLHHLTTGSGSSRLGSTGRQTLLKLLVGAGNQEDTIAESFRALALDALQRPSKDGVVQTTLGIYRAYIVLLGQLGAVASLWQEWRLSATQVDEFANNGKSRGSGSQPDSFASNVFQAAVEAARSVVTLSHDTMPTNLDLAGCATLDLKSIKQQNQDSWLGSQQNEAHPGRQQMSGRTRAALELPLDGWMQAVRLLP